ncbi:MAG: sigma-70 family RNA polymerase sigma factor [Planctomycetes bacterium]|nr:sigma-70 family RNA polymerase sigma factor [Planctomycetota bacterium]
MMVSTVNNETLEHLIRDHQHGVWRYLRYLGCEPAMADDLTQEAFVSVIEGGFVQRSEPETAAYLRKAARFAWLNRLRRENRGTTLDEAAVEIADDVWARYYEAAARTEYLGALEHCLDTLEPRDRNAVRLKYNDERSLAEVARSLDMTEDSVKTHFARLRKKLRECIEARLEQ